VLRRVRTWPGVLLAVCVTACGAGVAPMHPPPAAPSAPAATAADVDQDAVEDLVEHHRHHHHGGLTMFVAMGLDTLGLTPAQQASLTSLQSDLYAAMRPARDAENDVYAALGDGVAAGAVDRAKVDAAVARLESQASGVFGAAEGTLDRLHAALSPEQRATLADKVEAQWTVWREANPLDEANRPHGQLASTARALALTPSQTDAARARFAALMKQAAPLDVAHVEARLQAFEQAFAADAFDAHALRSSAVGSELAAWGATRLARYCEALVGTLTPDQRTKLAAMLREHATHHEEKLDAEAH